MSDKVSISELWERFDQFEEKMDKRFTTKQEFLPVRLLVYGAVAIALTKIASTGLGYIAYHYNLVTIAQTMGY